MKNYVKPEIDIIRLENDSDNMTLVSGNYSVVKFTKSTTEYNIIDF